MITNYPGTLGATKWAGSQPGAHGAARMTSGTLGAARLPNFTLGTVKAGSIGSNMPPPATPHFVCVTVRLTPGVTTTASAALIQRGAGTISYGLVNTTSKVEHKPLSGWIQPAKGTYRVLRDGSASMLRWLEYDQR